MSAPVFAAARDAAFGAAALRDQRSQLQGLNAHERHIRLMHDYVTYYGGGEDVGGLIQGGQPQQQLPLTDEQVLADTYRFIRDEGEDAVASAEGAGSWRVAIARRYYARLYREYAIADLSRYREGKVGLRWRTRAEVVAGTGQFACGARRCGRSGGLASYEVPFAYQEAGQRKQALVKVRLCPEHATQLNYRKLRRLADDAQTALGGSEDRKRRKKQKKDKRRKKGSRKAEREEEGGGRSDSSDDEGGGRMASGWRDSSGRGEARGGGRRPDTPCGASSVATEDSAEREAQHFLDDVFAGLGAAPRQQQQQQQQGAARSSDGALRGPD